MDRFLKHRRKLENKGYEVTIPAFDDHPYFDAFDVCEHNYICIKKADEVHMIWDGRSIGTIFDFGMVFALRKPFKIIYIEPKTVKKVMQMYSKKFK